MFIPNMLLFEIDPVSGNVRMSDFKTQSEVDELLVTMDENTNLFCVSSETSNYINANITNFYSKINRGC